MSAYRQLQGTVSSGNRPDSGSSGYRKLLRTIYKTGGFRATCLPVRAIGLEPTHREIPDPKSGASANSATPAIKARS